MELSALFLFQSWHWGFEFRVEVNRGQDNLMEYESASKLTRQGILLLLSPSDCLSSYQFFRYRWRAGAAYRGKMLGKENDKDPERVPEYSREMLPPC